MNNSKPAAIPTGPEQRQQRDELMTETEVAEELRVTTFFLKRRRDRKQGPAYVRVGRLIRYRRSAIDSFLLERGVSPVDHR